MKTDDEKKKIMMAEWEYYIDCQLFGNCTSKD